MADTTRGDYTNQTCECGKMGCVFHHWGPLVPRGERRALCAETMRERDQYFRKHGVAMPDALVTKHAS